VDGGVEWPSKRLIGLLLLAPNDGGGGAWWGVKQWLVPPWANHASDSTVMGLFLPVPPLLPHMAYT